jgi:hypothetical protein
LHIENAKWEISISRCQEFEVFVMMGQLKRLIAKEKL